MHIPFYARPLSVGVSITFFRPLFVCFLYIHLTVASGRFPQLLERGRDNFRPTQEERWRRLSSRFVSKMAPIALPSSVFSSSSSTGYIPLLSMGVEKDSPSVEFRASSLSSFFRWCGDSDCVCEYVHGGVGVLLGLSCSFFVLCVILSGFLSFSFSFSSSFFFSFSSSFSFSFSFLFGLLFSFSFSLVLFLFLVLCLVLPRSLFVSFVFVFSLLFFRLFVLFVFLWFCLCFLSFVLFSFSPVPLAFGCVVCVSLSCQFGALFSLSLFLCLIFLALALVFSPLFPLRFFPFLFSCFTPCVFRGLVSLLDYYWVLLLVLVVVLRIAFLLCNYHCFFLHFAFYPRNRC